jgi:hypothetical protein
VDYRSSTNTNVVCLYRNQAAGNPLINLALLQSQRDRSQSHSAFTRQRPLENDASSARVRRLRVPYLRFPEADLNEAALRRTHSRVAEPTVEVI